MKQITLLLLLCMSMACFSQDKYDFKNRSKEAVSQAEWYAKKKFYKSSDEAFAGLKIKYLEKVVQLTTDDKTKLNDFYKSQYLILKEAYDAYTNGETAQSKINLINTLLKIEDDGRKQLSDKQLIFYKSFYSTDYYNDDYFNFRLFFMPEQIYYTYKKELL